MLETISRTCWWKHFNYSGLIMRILKKFFVYPQPFNLQAQLGITTEEAIYVYIIADSLSWVMDFHFRAARHAMSLVPLRVFGQEGHCTGICVLDQVYLWLAGPFICLCLSFFSCKSWITDPTPSEKCCESWDEQFNVALGIIISTSASGGFFSQGY